jgi:hypothetical protein
MYALCAAVYLLTLLSSMHAAIVTAVIVVRCCSYDDFAALAAAAAACKLWTFSSIAIGWYLRYVQATPQQRVVLMYALELTACSLLCSRQKVVR